jgi:hypothetical protein
LNTPTRNNNQITPVQPKDASNVDKLVIMPTIAQSAIHRHPIRTIAKGLTRLRLPVVMCRIKISRTRVKAE